MSSRRAELVEEQPSSGFVSSIHATKGANRSSDALMGSQCMSVKGQWSVQDLPDGNYHLLRKTGKMQKSSPLRSFINGITNYRMWGLAACYAYSFGVEVRSSKDCTIDLVPHLHTNMMLPGCRLFSASAEPQQPSCCMPSACCTTDH